MDTENGWRRMECVIVGPSGAQNQSLAAQNFKQQIIAILQYKNFSLVGSEVASRKIMLYISSRSITKQ